MNYTMPNSILSSLVKPWIELSYPSGVKEAEFLLDQQHYAKGPEDIRFILLWTIVFAIAREASIRFALQPFIRWWLNMTPAKQPITGSAARRIPKQRDSSPSSSSSSSSNGDSSSISLKKTNGAVSRNASKKSSNQATKATKGSSPHSRSTVSKERKSNEKKVTRFAEQGWLVLYYTLFSVFGLVSYRVLAKVTFISNFF